MTIVAAVNGKRAEEFTVSVDATESEIINMAHVMAAAKLSGVEIVKTIMVPKKLVNFVVKK